MEAHFSSPHMYTPHGQALPASPSVCHGCSHLSSAIATLKARIQQLEIEKAVTESEKIKVEDGLQCLVGFLTSQRSASPAAGLQRQSVPNQAGRSVLSSCFTASLDSQISGSTFASAAPGEESPREGVNVSSNSANGVSEEAQCRSVHLGPAPKPSANWKTTEPQPQQADLIDLSDEGYISHFESSEQRPNKLSLRTSGVPSVKVTYILPSIRINSCSGSNQKSQLRLVQISFRFLAVTHTR